VEDYVDLKGEISLYIYRYIHAYMHVRDTDQVMNFKAQIVFGGRQVYLHYYMQIDQFLKAKCLFVTLTIACTLSIFCYSLLVLRRDIRMCL